MMHKRSFFSTVPEQSVEAGLFLRTARKKRKRVTSTYVKNILSQVDLGFLTPEKQTVFSHNLKKLIRRWIGNNAFIGDTEGTRLVTSLLLKHSPLEPVIVAVIAQDEETFNQTYDALSCPHSYLDLLELACVNGAQGIIQGLLHQPQKEDLLLRSANDLLAYAISSGNENCAYEVAQFFKEKGVSEVDRDHLHLYCFGETGIILRIMSLFNSSSVPQYGV